MIVRLNPDFNCCNSLALSWVHKVTTGTQSFASVITNVVFLLLASLNVTKFGDQVGMRLISQLINAISRVLQKLLKYFNGIIIWTAFVALSHVEILFFFLIFIEALLWGKLSRAVASVKAGSSLQCFYKLPDVLNNHHYVLLNLLCIIYFAHAISKWCTIF